MVYVGFVTLILSAPQTFFDTVSSQSSVVSVIAFWGLPLPFPGCEGAAACALCCQFVTAHQFTAPQLKWREVVHLLMSRIEISPSCQLLADEWVKYSLQAMFIDPLVLGVMVPSAPKWPRINTTCIVCSRSNVSGPLPASLEPWPQISLKMALVLLIECLLAHLVSRGWRLRAQCTLDQEFLGGVSKWRRRYRN